MAIITHRIGHALALASLLALSAQVSAQRSRQAGGGGRAYSTARTHSTQTNRSAHAAQTNRTAHAGQVNRNATVNRNVNRTTNVNVNRNVNVNTRGVGYWGRPAVRAGVYAWPRGYSYVRRPVGYIMPRPFLASAYYYSGWATLGLAAPMAGYQWVRYGSDLLLIEIATGRVADVRYGVFAG